METVVDVLEKPDMRLYAYWAYAGCGYESFWGSFDAFLDSYIKVKAELEKCLNAFEEFDLFKRFGHMVKQLTDDSSIIENVTKAVSKNYWRNYKSNCIVFNNVKSCLAELHEGYKLGIVSNFAVEDGIEELLEINGIGKYFDFVVTSIKTGWKKPHFKIYDTALELAKVTKEEILFVGDDYVCDYEGPKKYGFDAVLLDKDCNHGNVEKRIVTIDKLTGYLI